MASEKQTISKVKTTVYVPLGFATGLVDLNLTIRRPNGTIFNTITMTEESGGIYTASYTPDATGTWQEKVESTTNEDKVINSYDVVSYDADDVKSQTDSIETKVDTIDSEVGVIDSNVDSVKTTVETTDGKVDVVDSNVDAVKTKTDNLPADTSTELDDIDTAIQNVYDNLPGNGGYFA